MAGTVYNPSADVNEILAAAEKSDPATRFALLTTLNRYQAQLAAIADLQADIRSRGTLVAEPGKRKKAVPNPSLAEYNKLSAAAASTVNALLRICTAAGITYRTAPPGEDDEL